MEIELNCQENENYVIISRITIFSVLNKIYLAKYSKYYLNYLIIIYYYNALLISTSVIDII